MYCMLLCVKVEYYSDDGNDDDDNNANHRQSDLDADHGQAMP